MMNCRILLMKAVFLVGGIFPVTSLLGQVYPSFPYVSNFGSPSAPGADNNLYKFKVFGSENPSSAWAFRAVENKLYPSYQESLTESKSTMLTRPFRMKKNREYTLRFTYYGTREFSDAKVLVRLAPIQADGSFDLSYSETVQDQEHPANLFLALENGIAQNEVIKTYHIAADALAADSTYALSVCVYSSEGFFLGSDYIRVHQIEIEESNTIDLSVGKIISPISSCDKSSQAVSFFVKNNGGSPITSFTAHYRIGNGAVETETFEKTILAWDTASFTFAKPIDLSIGIRRIEVFTEPLMEEAEGSNDTSTKYISFYEQDFSMPRVFDFSDGVANRQWNMMDKEVFPNLSWRFRMPEGGEPDAVSLTNKENNDDYLMSPSLSLDSGKTYIWSFSYAALDQAQKENLSLVLIKDLLQDHSKDIIIWEKENFSHTNSQQVSIYFTPDKTQNYSIAFRAYSPSYAEGVRVSHVKIDTISPLSMDFFYDFDPNQSTLSASLQLEKYADLLDADGEGQAWSVNEVANTDEAYNSAFYIRALGAKGQKCDDWIVFKPVFLKAGTTYTLAYTRKAGSEGKKAIVLQTYLQKTMPPYIDQVPDELACWQDTVKNAAYAHKQQSFTPSTSGTYILSFRYKTEIPSVFGTNPADYALNLDNIRFYEQERKSVHGAYAIIPVEAEMGGDKVYVSLRYKNHSGQNLSPSEVSFYYRVNNGNVVESHPVADIKPYEVGTHVYLTTVDFSKDSVFKVLFWTHTAGVSIEQGWDTIRKSVKTMESYQTPFWEAFSDSSHLKWRFAAIQSANPGWSILKSAEAYSAPYAATCEANAIQMDGFLVFPALKLNKDTTYMISFYVKSSEKHAKDSVLSLNYSHKGVSSQYFIGNTLFTVDSIDREYQRCVFYYRPKENTPIFLALRAQIPAFKGRIWIDDILVMDSVSSLKTNLALNQLQYSQISACDQDKTTEVSCELENRGFLPIKKVRMAYQLDKNPLKYVEMENLINVGEKQKVVLPEKWDLSQEGTHSLLIFLNMENEGQRANDTLRATAEIGKVPVLPVSYDFENGLIPGQLINRKGGKSAWAVVEDPKGAHAGSKYMKYKGNGIEAEDDFVMSCFNAPEGEYTVDFYARVAQTGSEERMSVYLISLESASQEKVLLENIQMDNSTYNLHQLAFKIETAGNYAILFRAQSLADGVEIALDDVMVTLYGMRDIALTKWVSPQQEDRYTQPSTVQVKYKNMGWVIEKNIPITLLVNEKVVSQGVIPAIEAQTERDYTFATKVNMQPAGRYKIRVCLGWVADENRTNDTLEVLLIQKEITDIVFLSILSPVKKTPPYGKQEVVSVQIKNQGKSTLSDIPLEAQINQQKISGKLPRLEAGETTEFRFETTVDMSESAWYNLCVYSKIPSDRAYKNDTLCLAIDGTHTGANAESNQASFRFGLYPNPTQGPIHLKISQETERIEVWSSQGVCLRVWQVQKNRSKEISVYDLSQGLYILRAVSAQGVLWQTKFLKK